MRLQETCLGRQGGLHTGLLELFATGFRVVPMSTISARCAGRPVVPNVDLAPEYLTTVEQGLTWSLKPNSDLLRIQLAAFGSLWNDAIVQENASLNGDTTLVIDGDTARNQQRECRPGYPWRAAGGDWQASGPKRRPFRDQLTKGNSHATTPLSHIPPTFGLLELSRKGAGCVGRCPCIAPSPKALKILSRCCTICRKLPARRHTSRCYPRSRRSQCSHDG